MFLLRSMLFIPGNNKKMILKASTLGMDAIILDLEDAVPIQDKVDARQCVSDSIRNLIGQHFELFIRINSLRTGLAEEDITLTFKPGIKGIVLPKTESADDIKKIDELLSDLEIKENIPLGEIYIIALIESAFGVLNAFQIASCPRVIALAFGALDFARDMGISITSDAIELLYPRSHIAIVSRAAAVLAIDTPWINIVDMDGLVKDITQARRLGFQGKLCIHPNQIEPIHSIFSPTEDELNYAVRVVTEYNNAINQGLGAISLDGKMIDEANYRQAQDVIDLVNAIRLKTGKVI